ncbi:hypothetical protein NKG05_18270 [Oerskovia sp. M15]
MNSPSLIEPGLDPRWVADIVTRALDEDLGPTPGRDVTTQATVPPSGTGTAHLVARADGVVAASWSWRRSHGRWRSASAPAGHGDVHRAGRRRRDARPCPGRADGPDPGDPHG